MTCQTAILGTIDAVPTDDDPVVVFAVALELDPARSVPLSAWCEGLDDAERARAARFTQDLHRRRFVARRWALRCLLSDACGVAPETIAYRLGAFGRPSLASDDALRFSTSHSGDMALIAIRRAAAPFAIDLERYRMLDDADGLVARFFSAAERRAYAALDGEDRVEAFWRGWTVKEAFVKALGQGLSFALDAFDVALTPDRPAAIDAVRGAVPAGWTGSWPTDWAVETFAPAPGYRAALVGQGMAMSHIVRRIDPASLPMPRRRL